MVLKATCAVMESKITLVQTGSTRHSESLILSVPFSDLYEFPFQLLSDGHVKCSRVKCSILIYELLDQTYLGLRGRPTSEASFGTDQEEVWNHEGPGPVLAARSLNDVSIM